MELVLAMYNAHPYFPLKNLGRKVHMIHDKIQYLAPLPKKELTANELIGF